MQGTVMYTSSHIVHLHARSLWMDARHMQDPCGSMHATCSTAAQLHELVTTTSIALTLLHSMRMLPPLRGHQ